MTPGPGSSRPSAGGCPTGNDRARGSGEEFFGQFQHNCGDVLVVQRVLRAVHWAEWVTQVNQIEGLSQVHDKRVLALAHKHAPWDSRTRQLDGVDIAVGISVVVRERFIADVIDGLGENGGAIGQIGDVLGGARAPIAVNRV